MTGAGFDKVDIETVRDDLVDILYEAVGDQAEFRFDDSIASLAQDANGVDVTFDNHRIPRETRYVRLALLHPRTLAA